MFIYYYKVGSSSSRQPAAGCSSYSRKKYIGQAAREKKNLCKKYDVRCSILTLILL